MTNRLMIHWSRTRGRRVPFALMAASAACTTLPLGAASAQESQRNRPEILEEVLVTAQKRTERLQDVPIAISSISGEAIQSRGVKELADLAYAVPGISFSAALNGRSRFAIRGISTTTEIPTVELFMDDIPVSSRSNEVTGAANPDILDLDHVEVLKGPQGTLYGGSSMGGAIKFITRRPDVDGFSGDIAADASSTQGGDPSYEMRGNANLPIVQGKLALRLSAMYRDTGGFVDRIAGGEAVNANRAATDASGTAIGLGADGRPLTVDPATGYATSVPPRVTTSLNTRAENNINDAERTAVRAALLYAPDETLSILPAFTYQSTDVDDFGYFWGNLDGFKTSGRTPETGHDGMELYSLSVEKNFDGVALTSISSYRERPQYYHSDSTFYIGGQVAAFATFPSDTFVNSNFNYKTQELRLTSTGDSRLKWTTGLYYAAEKNHFRFTITTPGAASIGIPPLHGVPDVLYATTLQKGLKQYAGFGEGTYELTDKFDVTLGVRAFKFEEDIDRFLEGLLAGGTVIFKKETSEDGLTPKVSFSYKVTPDNLIYVSATKGFRTGGTNNGVPEALCAADLARIGKTSSPNEYDSDSLWNYEIGSKNRTANGRLTLNAAAFYIDWSKVQQQVFMPGCGFTFTTNAGEARSQGGEIEIQAAVTEGFTFGAAATLTDAEITKALPGAGALSGDRLLTTPKWTFQANAEYRFPIGAAGSLFVRGDYQYRSDQWRNFNQFICRGAPGAVADPSRVGCQRANEVPVEDVTHIQDGYGSTNAAMGWDGERWDLQLFVNNVFNQRPIIDFYTADFVERQTSLRPRTIGMRFNRSF